MNKELEEAIKTCNEIIKENKRTIKILQRTLKSKTEEEYLQEQNKAIETALNYINNSILKEEIEERIEIHKMAQEAFGEKYRMTKYTDDDIRARDFYMIVSEDLIVKELQEILEGK